MHHGYFAMVQKGYTSPGLIVQISLGVAHDLVDAFQYIRCHPVKSLDRFHVIAHLFHTACTGDGAAHIGIADTPVEREMLKRHA